jgi:hypothetical protein
MQDKKLQQELQNISKEKFDEAVEGLTQEEINEARRKAGEQLLEQKKLDTMKAEKLRVQKRNRETNIRNKNKVKRNLQKKSRKRNR